MSRWPVDDAASVTIMDNFYRGIKEGLSLTKSLKQAKCLYIGTAGKVKANPSYWASFQLTGYSDKIVIRETIENKSYLILGLGIVISIIILLTVRLYKKNKNL